MQSVYAANMLLIGSLAAAKASVTCLVIAINPSRKLLLACRGTLGFVAAWFVASIIALAFQCDLPSPWNSEANKCIDRFALNVGIHVINILTDVIIVVIPFLMMQNVQISSHRRWVVRGLFGSRLVYVKDVICPPLKEPHVLIPCV